MLSLSTIYPPACFKHLIITSSLLPGHENPGVGLKVSDASPLLFPMASTMVLGSWVDWSDLSLKLTSRGLMKLFAPLARVGGFVAPLVGRGQAWTRQSVSTINRVGWKTHTDALLLEDPEAELEAALDAGADVAEGVADGVAGLVASVGLAGVSVGLAGGSGDGFGASGVGLGSSGLGGAGGSGLGAGGAGAGGAGAGAGLGSSGLGGAGGSGLGAGGAGAGAGGGGAGAGGAGAGGAGAGAGAGLEGFPPLRDSRALRLAPSRPCSTINGDVIRMDENSPHAEVRRFLGEGG